ncbi:MAG: biopolymer transport protein ExbD [Verrucomicrobiales bacterium]|jgi:biopolymer transport protein ExbD
MARRRSANPFEKNSDDPDADVSPLIDVAFLLLIYFIVTTTLIKEESDIGMQLPGISKDDSESVEIDQLMIKILDNGTILVNDIEADTNTDDHRLPLLMDRLGTYSSALRLTGSESMVIIDCSNNTVHQRFIDVLHACHNSGLKNVSLTQPPD